MNSAHEARASHGLSFLNIGNISIPEIWVAFANTIIHQELAKITIKGTKSPKLQPISKTFFFPIDLQSYLQNNSQLLLKNQN